MEIKCPICGNSTKLDDKVCHNCGSTIQDIYQAFLRQKANSKSEDNTGYTTSELEEMFEFEKSGTGYAITEYYGLETTVFVPGKYKGRVINRIAPNSFEASDVVEVYLPKSVREIGHDAFADCFKLQKVLFTDRLRSIGASAFANCISLKSITIPKNVLEIGDHAFSGCVNLEKVKLPENLETIPEYMFENCTALPHIIMPQKVRTISSYAFLNCSGITKIKFNECLQSIQDFAFSGCSALVRTLLPESLITLGENVFHNCTKLKAVYIGASLVQLNGNDFYGCDSLVMFKVNPENTSFYTNGNCIISAKSQSLIVGCKSTVIPQQVRSISANAFCGYSFDGVIFIPATVISMENEAVFNNTNFVLHTAHTTKPKKWNDKWVIGENQIVWGVEE